MGSLNVASSLYRCFLQIVVKTTELNGQPLPGTELEGLQIHSFKIFMSCLASEIQLFDRIFGLLIQMCTDGRQFLKLMLPTLSSVGPFEWMVIFVSLEAQAGPRLLCQGRGMLDAIMH